MNTLYDLLGALPHDNAEALRAAFRRAVKGAHPDVRPDDPEAALKFREIVRANDILGDDEQRAAYDHLLELALRTPREIVAISPTGSTDTTSESAAPAKRGSTVIAGGANVPDAALPP